MDRALAAGCARARSLARSHSDASWMIRNIRHVMESEERKGGLRAVTDV